MSSSILLMKGVFPSNCLMRSDHKDPEAKECQSRQQISQNQISSPQKEVSKDIEAVSDIDDYLLGRLWGFEMTLVIMTDISQRIDVYGQKAHGTKLLSQS